MAAAKTGTGHKRIYLNESYFTETNCKPLEEDKCDYPNGCFCYPPFANGRSRIAGYFYSPEHKQCIKPSGAMRAKTQSRKIYNQKYQVTLRIQYHWLLHHWSIFRK
ncbi:hypothetical protein V5799_019702 [Amblyomma americanum]|uniref:Uncharacterized protein n=1 Tax=Amblyomma americanum TaxID=6943 RepID=A0AAQ4EW07_AMBAM